MAFKKNTKRDTSFDATTKVNNTFLIFVFLLFLLGNMPFKTTVYSIFIIILGVISFQKTPQIFSLILRSRLLVVLSGLIVLSYFWSLVPAASATFIQSQLVFIVFCICISVRYQLSGFSNALSRAGIIVTGKQIGRAHV